MLDVAGEKTLKSPEKKAMLSKKLDAWLEQVQQDAGRMTPTTSKEQK